jgi:hypothetical protein
MDLNIGRKTLKRITKPIATKAKGINSTQLKPFIGILIAIPIIKKANARGIPSTVKGESTKSQGNSIGFDIPSVWNK